MKIKLIAPHEQSEDNISSAQTFKVQKVNLPLLAGLIPLEHSIRIVDEAFAPDDIDEEVDLVGNDDISVPGTTQQDLDKYGAYCLAVDEAQARPGYEFLTDGSITQPNHVRALCTGDWKIVRYLDPNEVEPDEWELYCLVSDPTEQTNLVDFRTGGLREDATVPGLNQVQLRKIAQLLKEELAYQEALLMGES